MTMKALPLFSLLFFLFATLNKAVLAQSVALNQDNTPPDRTNSQLLTSYADILSKVTPAVVGIYTSQLVTTQERSSRGTLLKSFSGNITGCAMASNRSPVKRWYPLGSVPG